MRRVLATVGVHVEWDGARWVLDADMGADDVLPVTADPYALGGYPDAWPDAPRLTLADLQGGSTRRGIADPSDAAQVYAECMVRGYDALRDGDAGSALASAEVAQARAEAALQAADTTRDAAVWLARTRSAYRLLVEADVQGGRAQLEAERASYGLEDDE